MAQLGIVVNVPSLTKAALSNFIEIGEETARLVRKDSNDAQASLVYVATSDNPIVLQPVDPAVYTQPTAVSDKTQSRSITSKRATIAGGAAGNLTVTGIKPTNTLVAVIAVDDTTHAGVDQSAEFTISALNTINNSGKTATTGKHVVVIWI